MHEISVKPIGGIFPVITFNLRFLIAHAGSLRVIKELKDQNTKFWNEKRLSKQTVFRHMTRQKNLLITYIRRYSNTEIKNALLSTNFCFKKFYKNPMHGFYSFPCIS